MKVDRKTKRFIYGKFGEWKKGHSAKIGIELWRLHQEYMVNMPDILQNHWGNLVHPVGMQVKKGKINLNRIVSSLKTQEKRLYICLHVNLAELRFWYNEHECGHVCLRRLSLKKSSKKEHTENSFKARYLAFLLAASVERNVRIME